MRLELELAAIELKRKLGALGLGVGFGVGALFMLVLAVGFLHATIAAALALFLPTWLALLAVTLFLVAQAALLGALALGRMKSGTPPVPEQAIAEAKLTTEALRGDGDG